MTEPYALAIVSHDAPLDCLARLGVKATACGELSLLTSQLNKPDQGAHPKQGPRDAAAQILARRQSQHRLLETLMQQGVAVIAPTDPVAMVESQAFIQAVHQHAEEIKQTLALFGTRRQFEISVLCKPDDLTREMASKGLLADLEGLPPEAIAIALKAKLDAYKGRLASTVGPELEAVGDRWESKPLAISEAIVHGWLLTSAIDEPALDQALENIDARFEGRYDIHCIGPLPACHFAGLTIRHVSAQDLQKAATRLNMLDCDLNHDVIKSAFRDACRKVHPDLEAGRNGGHSLQTADDGAMPDADDPITALKADRQILLDWVDLQIKTGGSLRVSRSVNEGFVRLAVARPDDEIAATIRQAA